MPGSDDDARCGFDRSGVRLCGAEAASLILRRSQGKIEVGPLKTSHSQKLPCTPSNSHTRSCLRRSRGRPRQSLIRQLAAIECGEGLQQAARSLGVSYRYFWGEIEAWEAKFGQKLVIREQGRRARLSPLGAKLLWAERTVMANHAVQIEKMQHRTQCGLCRRVRSGGRKS